MRSIFNAESLLTCGLRTQSGLQTLLALLIFVNAGFSQTFDSETKLRNTVKIPAAILSQLEKTDEVKECLSRLDEPGRFHPAWFRAVRIDLNADGRADYLVESNKDCLLGPRAANWWVFSGTGRGSKLVYHDSVLWLTLLRHKTRGFRDIRAETTMMNIIRNTWKYDGREYKLVHTRIIEPER